MNKRNNISKDTKLGIFLYNTYFYLRTIIFIYDLFIVYRFFNGNTVLPILTIILNLLYVLIYNSNKFVILIILCIISSIVLKHILIGISIGMIIYNGIEYIIFLIYSIRV